MKSRYIIVKSRDTERTLKEIKDSGTLNYGLKFKREGDFVKIPVLESSSDLEEFEPAKRDNQYKHYLNIPDSLYPLLPTSFDMIGDIAVIKIPEKLSEYKSAIAEAICRVNRHINKVAEDLGVKGEFRVRDLRLLKGTDLITVHQENHIKIKVDLEKIYFSPRLAAERAIIASYVKDNETVLDMFCGVGPFSLLIAKSKNVKIYAIDKNPAAIEYLRENMKINKVSNIVPILGDSKEIIPTMEKVDRVIMNNPHHSLEFLDLALAISKHWIYFYIITDNKENVLELLKSKVHPLTYNIRLVHNYSPSESLFCFELCLNSL